MDRRHLTGFRKPESDEPGIVTDDDGNTWVIEADGDRSQLPGEVVDTDALVFFKAAAFVETAGAGIYTATIDLPDGATITYVGWRTTATWAATTTLCDFGVTGTPESIAADVNVDAISAQGLMPSNSRGPVDTSGVDFVATLVTTGSGGTTGRTKVWVGYVVDVPTQNAVKA